MTDFLASMDDDTATLHADGAREYTCGTDNDAEWMHPPQGLGIPEPDPTDVEHLGHGTSGGYDWVKRRLIEVPLQIIDGSAATMQEKLDAMTLAWSMDDYDTTLDINIGGRARRYYGRPRGLEVDYDLFNRGVMQGLVGHFEALDPWAYGLEGSEDTVTDDVLTVVNVGTVQNPTKSRCVVTLDATGGSGPWTLTNLDDPDGLVMTFLDGDDYEIDLYTQTVMVGSMNLDTALRNDSGWPVLKPGTNRFALGGFTDAEAVWRPAYAGA